MTEENGHVSPNLIEVFIHCYASPLVHPRRHAPAVVEAIAFLYENKLIEPVDLEGPPLHSECFKPTKKGSAWMRMLCATPFPSVVFMDPRVLHQIPHIDLDDPLSQKGS